MRRTFWAAALLLAYTSWASRSAFAQGYFGGVLKNHGHTSAAGDGGLLTGLTVNGSITTPSITVTTITYSDGTTQTSSPGTLYVATFLSANVAATTTYDINLVANTATGGTLTMMNSLPFPAGAGVSYIAAVEKSGNAADGGAVNPTCTVGTGQGFNASNTVTVTAANNPAGTHTAQCYFMFIAATSTGAVVGGGAGSVTNGTTFISSVTIRAPLVVAGSSTTTDTLNVTGAGSNLTNNLWVGGQTTHIGSITSASSYTYTGTNTAINAPTGGVIVASVTANTGVFASIPDVNLIIDAGGDGNSTGNGPILQLGSGPGAVSNAHGGNILLFAANATQDAGTGLGGDVVIQSGLGGVPANDGSVVITSSLTVKGRGGLGVIYGVNAATFTANSFVAVDTQTSVGNSFTVAGSTFQVLNSGVWAAPSQPAAKVTMGATQQNLKNGTINPIYWNASAWNQNNLWTGAGSSDTFKAIGTGHYSYCLKIYIPNTGATANDITMYAYVNGGMVDRRNPTTLASAVLDTIMCGELSVTNGQSINFRINNGHTADILLGTLNVADTWLTLRKVD